MMEPVAWLVKTRMGTIAWATWQPSGEPLVRLSDAEARIAELTEEAGNFERLNEATSAQLAEWQQKAIDWQARAEAAEARITELEAKLAEAEALIEAQQHDFAQNNIRNAENAHRATAAEALLKEARPHEPTAEMLAAAMKADQDGMPASMKTIWMVMWGAYKPARAIHHKIGVKDE